MVAKKLKPGWSTLLPFPAMIGAQKGGHSMTLGEKISALRNQHEMSQGDLAEKMNVSRQSISKWETDTSVPELDKLIQLSEVFHITLDELVKGDILQEPQTTESEATTNGVSPQPVQIVVQKSISTQKIVGFILLGIGLLCCVLALMFGSGLLVIGGYIIFCSIICLLIKRYAGLIIGWITILQAVILTPYFTGIRVFAVFKPAYYQNGISLNHIMAIAMWLVFIVLTFFTIRVFRKRK